MNKLLNTALNNLNNQQILQAYSITSNNLATIVNHASLIPVNYRNYIIAPRQDFRTMAALLKLHSLTRVTNAIDITLVDNIEYEQRFSVSYQLQSTSTNTRYSLTTRSSESIPLLSLQGLYPAFN